MAPEWRQVMGPRQRSARSEAGTGKPVARVGDSPPNYRRLFESGSHIALLAEIDRLKGIIKTLRVEVRTAQAASRQRGASTAVAAPVARMAPTGPTAPAPAAAADPAPAQLGAPTAEPECCICLDPNPSVVCVPCGHIVLCPGCVHLYVLQHHDCPLCRAPLDGVFDTSTARFTSFTTLAQPKRSFASALAAARPAGRAPA